MLSELVLLDLGQHISSRLRKNYPDFQTGKCGFGRDDDSFIVYFSSKEVKRRLFKDIKSKLPHIKIKAKILENVEMQKGPR